MTKLAIDHWFNPKKKNMKTYLKIKTAVSLIVYDEQRSLNDQ